MLAFDLLNNDKLNPVIEARNAARKEWIELETAYNMMDKSKKSKP